MTKHQIAVICCTYTDFCSRNGIGLVGKVIIKNGINGGTTVFLGDTCHATCGEKKRHSFLIYVAKQNDDTFKTHVWYGILSFFRTNRCFAFREIASLFIKKKECKKFKSWSTLLFLVSSNVR